MIRLWDDHETYNENHGSLSLINSSAGGNGALIYKPSVNAKKKCFICKKEENNKDPLFIKRQGEFVCSSDCYKRLQLRQTKKIPNQQDVDFLKKQFKRRRFLMDTISKFNDLMTEITKAMTAKDIEVSCFYNDLLKNWCKLEAVYNINFSGLYNWVCSDTGAEEHPEYCKRYTQLYVVRDSYEYEIEQIETFLTSGKCIRYIKA